MIIFFYLFIYCKYPACVGVCGSTLVTLKSVSGETLSSFNRQRSISMSVKWKLVQSAGRYGTIFAPFRQRIQRPVDWKSIGSTRFEGIDWGDGDWTPKKSEIISIIGEEKPRECDEMESIAHTHTHTQTARRTLTNIFEKATLIGFDRNKSVQRNATTEQTAVNQRPLRHTAKFMFRIYNETCKPCHQFNQSLNET